MFLLRVIALIVWTSYSWAMGQTPPDGLNGTGKFIALTFFITAPLLYMLPTYEAWKNNNRSFKSIGIVNFFFGWTVIGWVACFAWAFKPKAIIETIPADIDGTAIHSKRCPYCAEDIKEAAIKCKHCGTVLDSVVS